MKSKTFKCINKDCQYLRDKKYPARLFKGVVVGDSFVIIKCRYCNVERGVNVTKEELPKKVDTKPIKLEDIRGLLANR